MSMSRTAHVVSALSATFALVAAIYGSQRLAVALIVLTVLIHVLSLEALRVRVARPEKRP